MYAKNICDRDSGWNSVPIVPSHSTFSLTIHSPLDRRPVSNTFLSCSCYIQPSSQASPFQFTYNISLRCPDGIQKDFQTGNVSVSLGDVEVLLGCGRDRRRSASLVSTERLATVFQHRQIGRINTWNHPSFILDIEGERYSDNL